MTDNSLIVACDFGTTSFRAMVAEMDRNGRPHVIAGAVQPAYRLEPGIEDRRGVITNVEIMVYDD